MGFGEQHIHMTGQTASYRMDRELNVHTLVAQLLSQFGDWVLGLSHGHTVPGRNNDRGRLRQLGGQLVSLDLSDLPRKTLTFNRRGIAKATEDDRHERAVHSLAHDVGQDGAGEADEGTGDDKYRDVQTKSGEGSCPTGVAVQHRNDDWHIRATDSGDEVEAEEQRGQGQ